LNLQAATIQKVCQQYVKSRKQHKKRWLRYRGRKSLGWVPFRNDQVTFDGKAFTFDGVRYEPMHLREGVFYPAYGMSGSFNQDAKGHWYINVTVEMRVATSAPNTKVGIDLGLKSLATPVRRARDRSAEVLSQERGGAGNRAAGEEDAEAHPQDPRQDRQPAPRLPASRLPA
jgi:transposase